ncbi:hypothetical protein Tco_0916152 [Tanacetum coccineum]
MEQPKSSSSQQITPANKLECRIVGQILKDHALSNALTATIDVPKDIIYTLDIFCTALKLPTATVEKPFIPLADFPYIKEFLKILGYQGQI